MLTPQQALEQHFGLSQFRPSQLPIIENILDGKNTLATLPTGSGKSLTFQLPALLLEGTTLIISPLLSLIRDQVQKLHQQGIAVCQIDSTLTETERHQNLCSIQNGDIKIIYTSPETLSHPLVYKILKSINISLVAIDEAHCYSEWGHSFRPSYLSLPHLTRGLKPHAILALTATATRKVASDIRRAFKIKTTEHIACSPRRSNLSYTVIPCADTKRLPLLSTILNKVNHLPAIVYAMKQEQCEEIAGYLNKNNISARSYHAGMSAKPRKQIQDAFLLGHIKVIVATIAFGMGVDKSNIRSITHFHLPKSPEGWLQESGRAGRDGLPAHTYLLACGDDLIPLNNFTRARELKPSAIARLIEHLTSQGKHPVIQPYQLRVQLEVLSSTLDVLIAKLELTKLIKYSHTSWRYVKLYPIFGRSFNVTDYPKKQQSALTFLTEQDDRYDLHQSQDDFGIPTEKLYQTLTEIKQSGEYNVRFSGWQKHYRLIKPIDKQAAEVLSNELFQYHQEQLENADKRIHEVHQIATTKTCIPARLEKWFGFKNPQSCGQCSSCLKEIRPRKLPSLTIADISQEELETIQTLLKQRGKRLNNAQKLTRFLCGIPTPYLRHFYLFKDDRFGMLKHTPYEEVHAYSEALF